MASIGSADKRASQDEALRRARETYQEKETDQAKSHSAEMKRMNEAHQATIREMQKSHDSQMEDLKTKARDAVSNRDMRYQKEIEDLRGMHQNQLRRQAGDADARIQSTNENAKNEIEHSAMIKDQQKDVMAKQYDAQLKDTQKMLESNTTKNREVVQTTIADQRNRLGEAHAKELKAVTTDRDRSRATAQSNYNNLRKNKDLQLRDLDQSKKTETTRLQQNFQSNMREQSQTHQENLDHAREGFQQGLDGNRDRFQKALEKQGDASKNTTEAFKATINDRINNRLNSGEAENKHLQNEIVRQRTTLTRAKNREVQNTRDSMQANIENLEDLRKDTVDASNEKTQNEIVGLTKKNDSLINRTNRFYQDKIVNDRGMAEERLGTTKAGLEKRLQRSEMTADDRTSKLQAINARDEGNLKSFYEKSTTAQRENFDVSLRELRETNKRDQDLIFQNFAKQSTEREAKFQSKLTEVNGKFETQIADLKEDGAKKLQDQIASANKEKKVLTDQKKLKIFIFS